ncbi:Protein RKD4 [Carex littledalei]|uniref:Protein RKD4 n=1 Tax=Carex littledalei TaxID=544730 RepID=A0A833QMP6_9POAL|nr:Protein RKD4 [Carex littledalei]
MDPVSNINSTGLPEHDSNGANEQVGNVAGAEEDAIPIVEERALGSKVLGIDLNLPIVEETSDVERVDLPDQAPVDVNAPPMRKSGDLSIELVRPMFRKLQNEAAKELRVSQTTLKMWCRIKGIKRWPYRILTSMDGLARNVEEYGMDSYLKVNGIHLTLSELEEKKRKFEEDPTTPIDDEIFLLRNYMCKRKSNKRRYVKHVQS